MSDIIWAAIVAVAGSAISGSIAGFIAYKVAERQANVTESTVELNARIELEKVQAENERLRNQHREAERQNRQGTYHRFLSVLDRIDMMATGFPGTDEQFEATVAEYNFLHGGIHLFGDERVREALGPVVEGIARAAGSASDAGSVVERFNRGYKPLRVPIIQAEFELIEAMRADISILPRPDQGRTEL